MEPRLSSETSTPIRARKPSEPSLQTQLASDLAAYLKKFPNKNFAIRILAKESGLNEKTIRRLLSEENRPTYQTTFKLYSIFLEEEAYDKLLALCPAVVRTYLQDFSPSQSVANHTREAKLLELFQSEPVSAELFVMAGTGSLKQSEVEKQFGQYGLAILKRLLEAGLLLEVSKGTYSLSPKVPNLDGQVLKVLGEYFVRNFSKPREVMSENTISFYAESLNEDGLKAWLSLDRETFYKKLEIAKDPKYRGTNRVFSFVATDQIQREKV